MSRPRITRLRRAHITVALLLLAGAPAAAAQVGSTTDLITGVVSDSAGNAVAEATVEALSLDTQISRTQHTDARGRYTIVFPDGGGQYRMAARMIGMAAQNGILTRQSDEDRLVWNVRLAPSAVTLPPVVARARRPGRGREPPEPGSTERVLTPDAVSRLPIDATDLNNLAALVPGVVALDATDTTAAAFSVAGQRADANAITLDGLLFGSGSVPQDAVRSTRVVTSTYDVARGQFSGGLVSATTRSGTNVVQGSSTYALRDHALALDGGDSPFTSGLTQNVLGAGLGGPIVHNRLFVFGAGQAQLRRDQQPSLLSADPADLVRLGVSPDSVARLLTTLNALGVPTGAAPAGDGRASDNYSALLRFDYLLSDAHTLTIRGDWRGTSQDPTRVSPLALPETGGTLSTDGGGVLAALTSRFGIHIINESRAYYSASSRDGTPFVVYPAGRVQIASDLADTPSGIATVAFGGSAGLPLSSSTRRLEASDEVSWLPGAGTHRIKLGLLFTSDHSADVVSSDQLGTYVFSSLGDLGAGRPSLYQRTLAPSGRGATALGYAAYLGDTWRTSPALQLTYGARIEGSGFLGAPAYDAALDTVFGRRTDRLPDEWHLSPRVGFTWTVAGAGLPRLVVRGGAGEFRSPMPTALASLATASTGLTSSESQLACAGTGAPAPDWGAYAADPGAVPAACVAGGPSLALPSPNAELFAPGFQAPRSRRGSLGVQRSLGGLMRVSVDASYARGVSQTGLVDLNLAPTPAFTLASEGGRPVYAAVASIDPATGALSPDASRVNPRFGQVLEIGSGLASDTKQLTVSAGGITRGGAVLQTSYTFTRSRDQASSGGFGAATTAGNPNVLDWATSDLERRHAFLTTITYPIGRALELTTIGRLSSGTPYTPRVGSDVNGDGLRDDRAFIFDPTSAPPAVGAGMQRLLATAPGRVRDCLTAQLGAVAGRNSCTGPWQGSLDLQLNWRPAFLGLSRRLMLSVTTVNLLRGVDDLVHGSADAHGWGLAVRPDPTLLYVTGFDAASQSFSYAVNERFGATGGGSAAVRAPFQIGIQGRLTIGPDRQRQALDQLRQGGGARIVDRIVRLLPNPADSVLQRADSLGLTAEQRTRIGAVADSARARNAALGEKVRDALAEPSGGFDQGRRFAALRPMLQEAQEATQRDLTAIRGILTPEQWEALPAAVRNPPVRARGGDGAGGGGGRERFERQ